MSCRETLPFRGAALHCYIRRGDSGSDRISRIADNDVGDLRRVEAAIPAQDEEAQLAVYPRADAADDTLDAVAARRQGACFSDQFGKVSVVQPDDVVRA